GWNHSSFFSGGPIKAGGIVTLEKGKITLLLNYSGHYKPTDEKLAIALNLLKEKGINLAGVTVDLVPGKLSAVDFLTRQSQKTQ
ncbi:MAG TPA: hypothetical protein VN457_06725, partial [Chlamydiales bacterium]|nr:hypothetical protein [Chlamydiales bacterium]